ADQNVALALGQAADLPPRRAVEAQVRTEYAVALEVLGRRATSTERHRGPRRVEDAATITGGVDGRRVDRGVRHERVASDRDRGRIVGGDGDGAARAGCRAREGEGARLQHADVDGRLGLVAEVNQRAVGDGEGSGEVH